MPKTVSVAEARDQLTRLLREAEAGEPIEITRRGRPIAMLVAVDDYRRALPAPGWLDLVERWRDETEWTHDRVDELFRRDRGLGRSLELG